MGYRSRLGNEDFDHLPIHPKRKLLDLLVLQQFYLLRAILMPDVISD